MKAAGKSSTSMIKEYFMADENGPYAFEAAYIRPSQPELQIKNLENIIEPKYGHNPQTQIPIHQANLSRKLPDINNPVSDGYLSTMLSSALNITNFDNRP